MISIHSLCRYCLWYGSCYTEDAGRYPYDEGVVTDSVSDYIDVPWCLDPTDPEMVGLAEVDGRWYTESQARILHLLDDSLMEDEIYEEII